MNRDIRHVEHIAGSPTLIRPGQLLSDRTSLQVAARWIEAVTETGGVLRVRLSPGVDECDLAATLRDRGHRVSPNHILVGQPLFWGGPAGRPFPATELDPPPAGGDGTTVGLLDTGLAPHPWWERAPWFREHGTDVTEVADYDGDGVPDPQAGHGTFIAGLLVKRAPGVRLRATRLLDGNGVADEAALLSALARVRADPPRVLNLSFGCHTFDDQPPLLVSEAIAALGDTAVVACAGNTATRRPFWPAALPDVVAVGAVDASERRRAPFSGHGPWVDACAQGEWLTSTYLRCEGFAGYARWSGTSFSTALVSGAIADAAKDMSPREATAHVLDPRRSQQIPDLGVLVSASR
ncbi:Subtilase family protein [Sinosporangium album]|uniref:Subtilase family protein n=1 Tax=Sinosporangium album TaxID=504805 RepID=A0A1G7TEP4_9ACTN|nr:S8/S53 family peptidase [Sinosporangium album]SDG33661.1 Subtilase family protein [Sinosporangium album]